MPSDAGYWTDDELLFEWVQEKPPETLQHRINSALAHDLSRDRDLDIALFRNHNLLLSRDLDLEFALLRADQLNLDLDLSFSHNRDLSFSHDRDRALSQSLALTHTCVHSLRHAISFSLVRDLYLTLFLLQKRIAGKFPVYEGILLVKERQQRINSSQM